MDLAENLQFADFNLDQLLATAPASLPAAASQNIAITQSSAKRSRLAERIAQSDDLVRQVKQLQSHHQQLADLQRTAQEVTDLYQREKEQRLELKHKTKQFSERCAELEKELDAQVLNCESLQEELATRGLPVEARDVVEVLMQLAQKVGDDSGLMRREHNMIRKLKDYCKAAKIALPTAKSPNPGSTCRRKAVGTITSSMTRATQTHEVITPKPPAMCSIGVQIEMRKDMRDQGTQHKNTTTTRGTTTASFIKYNDVGTCFPEPKPIPSVQQILDEMLSWNNVRVPLSPIGDAPLLLEEEALTPPTNFTNTIGTCTTLCNVQRELDFVSIIQPTQIKVSNSRPPSRTMFESVKDEAILCCGSSYARDILNFLPHPENSLTNVPAQAFEELWQVFGQMVLGLLQHRSTSTQAASPSVTQADFTNWLHALYEGTQSHQKPMSASTTHNGKPNQDRDYVETTNCVDASLGTEPEVETTSKILELDLRPTQLPVKSNYSERGTTKRKRKCETSRRGNCKSRRRVQPKVVSSVQSVKTQCDIKGKNEEIFGQGVYNEMVKSPNPLKGEQLNSFEVADGYSSNENMQSASVFSVDTSILLEQSSTCGDKFEPVKLSEQCDRNYTVFKPNQELQQFPAINPRSSNIVSQGVKSQKIEKRNRIEDDGIALGGGKSFEEYSKESVIVNPAMSCVEEGAESAIQFLSNLNAFNLTNCDYLNMELDEEELRLLELTREQPLSSSIEKQQSNTDIAILEQQNTTVQIGSEFLSPASDYTPNASKYQLELSLFGSDSETEDRDQGWSISTNFSEDDIVSEPGSLIIDEEETSSNQSVTPTSSPLFSPSSPLNRKRNLCRSEIPLVGEVRLTRLRAKQLHQEEHIRLERKEQLEEKQEQLKEKEQPLEKTSKEQQKKVFIYFSEESPSSPNPSSSEEEEWESSKLPVEIPLERPPTINREPTSLITHVVTRTKAESRKKQKNYKPQTDIIFPKLLEFLTNGLDLESNYRDLVLTLQKVTNDEAIITNALITTFGRMDETGPNHIERLVKALVYMSCGSFTSIVDTFMTALEMRLFRSGKDKPLAPVALNFVKVYLKLIQFQSSHSQELYENPARLLLVKILYHYERDMALLVLQVVTEYPTVLPHREERGYDNSDPIITVIKHLLMSRKYDMQDPQSAERLLLSKLRFEYHFQPFQPTRQEVIEHFVGKIKAGKLHQHLSYALALFCRRSYSHPIRVVKEILTTHLVPLASSYCHLCTQSEDYDERLQTLMQCISMIVKELPLDTNISGYLVLFRRLLMAVPRPGVQESAAQAILRLQRFGFKLGTDTLQNYKPNYTLSPLTRAMMRSFAVRRERYQRPQCQRNDRERQC